MNEHQFLAQINRLRIENTKLKSEKFHLMAESWFEDDDYDEDSFVRKRAVRLRNIGRKYDERLRKLEGKLNDNGN